jgi:hypothetical protein
MKGRVVRRQPDVSKVYIALIFSVKQNAKQEADGKLSWFLLGLVFDAEDGGDVLLRNVEPFLDCTPLQARRP